jgi:uncharacterized membrane protein
MPIDFFAAHPDAGWLLLIGLAIFPRITLLVSSIATGGVWWWLGWFFAPHFLVAILATLAYGSTNIVLVVIAWLFALGGTVVEGKATDSVMRYDGR